MERQQDCYLASQDRDPLPLRFELSSNDSVYKRCRSTTEDRKELVSGQSARAKQIQLNTEKRVGSDATCVFTANTFTEPVK